MLPRWYAATFRIRRNPSCGFPNSWGSQVLTRGKHWFMQEWENFFRIENPDTQLYGISNSTRQEFWNKFKNPFLTSTRNEIFILLKNYRIFY